MHRQSCVPLRELLSWSGTPAGCQANSSDRHSQAAARSRLPQCALTALITAASLSARFQPMFSLNLCCCYSLSACKSALFEDMHAGSSLEVKAVRGFGMQRRLSTSGRYGQKHGAEDNGGRVGG